jgi:hypothetical protein
MPARSLARDQVGGLGIDALNSCIDRQRTSSQRGRSGKEPMMAAMHEIDYRIFGDDMQFVEIDLDPNEATVAEAGGMMYMDDGVEMETVFCDG